MINRMKYKLLVVALFLGCLFTTGCWDYRELNDMAIVTGLAIDKKDDQYLISVLIANSKKSQESAKEGEAQTIVYEGEGKTILEGINHINSVSPKEIYIGHLTVVVMSEEVAKEGIFNISDLLLRSPQSRKRFHFLISKDSKAGDVLKILSPLESFPSQNIANNLLTTSRVQAAAIDVLYTEFLSKVLTPGVSPVLPVITIEGDVKEGSSEGNLTQTDPKTILRLEPDAIFRNDKLIGFASDEEARAVNLINNDVTLNNVTIKCDDTNLIVRISASDTNKSVHFENGEPVITLNVKESGYITEINCNRNLNDPKVIEDIEKEISEDIKEALLRTVDKLQNKYQADVLGFGNLIYKYNHKYWKTVKDNWDTNKFRELEVKVNVDFHLSGKGSLEQTIRRLYDESKN